MPFCTFETRTALGFGREHARRSHDPRATRRSADRRGARGRRGRPGRGRGADLGLASVHAGARSRARRSRSCSSGASLGTGPRDVASLAPLRRGSGVAGAPIYAHHAHGWAVVTSASGGYLVGFVVAAAFDRLTSPSGGGTGSMSSSIGADADGERRHLPGRICPGSLIVLEHEPGEDARVRAVPVHPRRHLQALPRRGGPARSVARGQALARAAAG